MSLALRPNLYPLTLAQSRRLLAGEGQGHTSSLPPRAPDLDHELGDVLRLDGEESTELLLVRHAEPTDGRPGLSATGRLQARRLADRLSSLWVETVYASPEANAVETARLVAEAIERPLVTVADLHEVGYEFGIAATDCVSLEQRFLANPRWDALPGFEASLSFRDRVILAIEALLAKHAARRVVLVTHASVINVYLSMLLDLPRDVFCLPDYASISTVRSRRDLRALRGLNDTAHLIGIGVQWPDDS